MIVINTVSGTKFSFNGVTYHKNFMPFVTGDKIAILNVYDSCITLTDAPTHFSDYVVNGVTYTSVEALQAALLDVIYTRVSLGAVGSGTVTSVSGTGTVSGITLSGTVNTSGSLILGGALSLTSEQITAALGFTPYNDTNPAGYITLDALSNYLPLTGGTLTSSGSVNTLNINHTSGSGLALNILKNGNGEGLKVVKGSGSGLAASITGGITLLSQLNLTTKLADAHINSAVVWNAKIGGSIASGQVAFGTASGVIGGDAGLTWDNTAKVLSTTNDVVINGINIGRGGGNVSSNTRVGFQSLLNNTVGSDNTALGVSALYSNTTGSINTAIGAYALAGNTTGSNNVAIGSSTLAGNTTGGSNVAIGASALYSNTIGVNNTGIGVQALYSNTEGNSNTANGFQSLYSNTTGSDNTANGFNALRFNTTGSFNTANGVNALYSNTTGGNNTANGVQALSFNTTGSNNVANGVNAGAYIADGATPNTITNNSVFIGANTRALANNQTNQIVIGDNAIGLGSNTVTLGNTDITITRLRGQVRGGSFVRDGGTSSQYLMADGTVSTLTNPITGTGTTNYLPKFTGASALGDSLLYDNGSQIGTYLGGQLTFYTNGNYSFTHNGVTIPQFGLASGLETGGTGNAAVFLSGYAQLKFFTKNVLRATISNSGNLGLGVTPSAWRNGNIVIDIGATTSLVNAQDLNTRIYTNAFVADDGISTYKTNGFATYYDQGAGLHHWFTAPSGTAGSAISFTQAMTLTSSGNLLINTTTDSGFKLDVNGSFRANTRVNFASLPTSATGLLSGDLWRNGTIINIVA